MRIASLLASGTEIVCALGLGDSLVAISHECDFPPEILDRPRVSRPRFAVDGLSSGAVDAAVRSALAEHGSVYELDETGLKRSAPDLILTQDVCEVCAVPTSLAHRAVRAMGGTARVLSLDAHRVADILDTVRQVAVAAGVGPRGEAVVGALEARLADVAARVAGRERPRALVLEWLDPVFVPGHWGPEMVELAGGVNVAGAAGARSQEVPWERLAGLDPDVLVIAPCGYGVAAARADADAVRARLERIAPRAIAAGRAWVADGSAYFNRSGPRFVDGVEILARLFHPDALRDVALDGRAARWPG